MLLCYCADYRYRKDEIFKRLKVTTFAQLVKSMHAGLPLQIDTVEPLCEGTHISGASSILLVGMLQLYSTKRPHFRTSPLPYNVEKG